LTVSPEGAVTLGERFLTFANPGRPLTPPIVRLTAIRDEDLRGAPSSSEAVGLFIAFALRDGPPCFVGHNVGFDVSFLERAGMPRVRPAPREAGRARARRRAPARSCGRAAGGAGRRARGGGWGARGRRPSAGGGAAAGGGGGGGGRGGGGGGGRRGGARGG